MKLSIAEKAVIGIALLAAVFTIGFFAGRSGGGTFVVETEKNASEALASVSENSDLADTIVSPNGSKAPSTAVGEVASDTDVVSGNTSAGLININTADSELLKTLPGIGEQIAARIIAYREENGGFAFVDEIMDVSGIGEKIFERIEPMITVD